MAYVGDLDNLGLGQVMVTVDPQASRPREPAAPLPSTTVNSPLMASRVPRPRETPTTLLPDQVRVLLADILRFKNREKELTATLHEIGRRLAAVKQALSDPTLSRVDPAQHKALSASSLLLQNGADQCIAAIKAAAAAANQAAAAAAAKGVSQAEITRVASITKTPVAAQMPTAREGFTAVVETRSPKVIPGSQGPVVVPGEDATVVEVPTSTPATPAEILEDVERVVLSVSDQARDATDEARGKIPGWALGLGAVALGYGVWRALQRKG